LKFWERIFTSDEHVGAAPVHTPPEVQTPRPQIRFLLGREMVSVPLPAIRATMH